MLTQLLGFFRRQVALPDGFAQSAFTMLESYIA